MQLARAGSESTPVLEPPVPRPAPRPVAAPHDLPPRGEGLPPARPAWSRSLLAWIDERTGLLPALALGRSKQVPIHRHSVWYYLGGMAVFLVGVQVATGLLLALYYRPSADEAFESVQLVITKVPYGWLIRSLHAWSANLLVFVLFLHRFSTYFMKA